MRISTQTFYEQNRAAMGAQQSSMLRVQQQITAGTKILTPSDDPQGTARALSVSQSVALNTQYSNSREQAAQTLSLEDTSLGTVTTVLQNIRSRLIEAGNGTMTDADRSTIANTLQSSLDQLQGLANTDDGNGNFLFAGFKSGSAPFVRQSDGSIQYIGDQGERMVQVDVLRQMAGADDGRNVFLSVQGGAGYVVSAQEANAGSGIFGPPSVVDSSNPDFGKNFIVSFQSASTYTVTTGTLPPVTSSPASYTPGAPINFGGVQLSISGTPTAGDIFNVGAAKNAGTDMFGTIRDAISALQTQTASGGAPAQARLANALSTGNRKMANAYDNVLTVRASVGSRLQELDTLNASGESRKVSDKSRLSGLQDLDYATAISEFYQRQTALQASQQTFVKIQHIALFNYL